MTDPYEAAKPTTGLDLDTVPQAILAAVNAFFAANNVALPDRQYITASDPSLVAWDCEQLTVAFAELGWGRSPDATQLSPSFGKQASVGAMRHVTYAVSIVRPHPTITDDGDPPAVADLQAAGAAIRADAGLLSQCLVNFVSFRNDALPAGGSAQAGAVQVNGPSGGFIGTTGALIITAGELAAPGVLPHALPASLAIRNGSPGGGL